MSEQKKPSRLEQYIQNAKEKTEANEVGDWIASKGGHLTIMIVTAVLIIGFIVTAISGVL